MRIGVLGTGQVGEAIATKLAELGHEVKMGSRSAGNDKAVAWAGSAGDNAGEGSFADAAAHGELVFNCTAGQHSAEALEEFGWPAEAVIDLGGLESARATEMSLPLWLRLMGVVGGPDFNVHVAR